MTNLRELHIEILHPGAKREFSEEGANRIFCLDLDEFKAEYKAAKCIEELKGYVESSRCYARREEWPEYGDQEEVIAESEVTWPDSESPLREGTDEALAFEEPSCVLVLAAISELRQNEKLELTRIGTIIYEKPAGYDQAYDDRERVQILEQDLKTSFEDKTLTEGDSTWEDEGESESRPDPRVYAKEPYQVTPEDLHWLLERAQMPDRWRKDD